jgi:hypothetical protein
MLRLQISKNKMVVMNLDPQVSVNYDFLSQLCISIAYNVGLNLQSFHWQRQW